MLMSGQNFHFLERNVARQWGRKEYCLWNTIAKSHVRCYENSRPANGVFDQRIDTHSLRGGGATALYTQGVPLGVIQRWGRWQSLTFHQYLRHDASALNRLSETFVRSHGLLECLKLMTKMENAHVFSLVTQPWVKPKGRCALHLTPWMMRVFYRMTASGRVELWECNQNMQKIHRFLRRIYPRTRLRLAKLCMVRCC